MQEQLELFTFAEIQGRPVNISVTECPRCRAYWSLDYGLTYVGCTRCGKMFDRPSWKHFHEVKHA